ncbi:MAG: hypothetical protein ACKOAO_05110 [Oxalobacteraceae bacterium]
MFTYKTSRILSFGSVILVCLLSLLTGCASITGSKNQPVSVSATCDGQPVTEASCTLMNDKGSWYVKTPGSVMIQKAYGDLAVDCKKGDSVASTKFKSSSNGGVWGNILAGGIIGYAVDASSGAGFDYPSTMTVTLPPPCGTSAPKTAAAD